MSAWPTPVRAAQDNNELGLAIITVSAFTIGVLDLSDIATAASSARRYNAHHGLSLVPTIDPIERRLGFQLQIALRGSAPTPAWSAGYRPFQESAHWRSPATATAWSLAATTILVGLGILMASVNGWNTNQNTLGLGIATVGLGVLVGPSTGQWYAGQSGRGWTTLAIRVVASLVGFAALTQLNFD